MILKEEKEGIDIFSYICLTNIKALFRIKLLRVKEGGDNMKGLQQVAYILVIVGAINWGLVGLFNLNLVNAILGSIAGLEKIVYILVGLSGVLMLVNWGKK